MSTGEPSAPATGDPSESSTWDDRRWHYRRSLASRVVLLTTMAVGLAVALVALGAYVTVRMSLESSLDNSLLDRANRAARTPALDELLSRDIPTWALGAGDVRIFVLRADGTHTNDSGPSMQIGDAELAVAKGASTSSTRTITAGNIDYRVVTVPTAREGTALIVAQNMAPQERVLQKMGAVMLLFGLAGVIGAAAAGWGVARNGLRPVRRLTTNIEELTRTEDLTPLPVEGDDEIARLATAFNGLLAALLSLIHI